AESPYGRRVRACPTRQRSGEIFEQVGIMCASQFLWSSLEVGCTLAQHQETSKGPRAAMVPAQHGDKRLFSLQVDVVNKHVSILEAVRDDQRRHMLHIAQLCNLHSNGMTGDRIKSCGGGIIKHDL